MISLITLQEKRFFIVDVQISFALRSRNLHFHSDRIIVRRAELSDKKSVIAVAGGSFRYSRFHLDPFIGEDIANKIKSSWIENYFVQKRGDILYVAEYSGEVVGFIAVIIKQTCNGVTAIIDLIGVNPPYHRKGVGKSLVYYLMKNHPEYNEIQVGTQIANKPSIQFYQNCGFRMYDSRYILHYHKNREMRGL